MKTQVTNQHNYTIGELKSVEEFDRSKTYLKVIREDKNHFDMEYKLGLNEDMIPFNDDPEQSCVAGGLYFTTLEHLPEFCDYGILVAEIKILEDSKLIKDSDVKYRTDKFEILKFWKMNDFLEHVRYIHIDGKAKFKYLETAKGLENLETIGGYAEFRDLETAKGLENLETIGGTVFFETLKLAEGLENLKSISGSAYFNKLETAKGLENLEIIDGCANFYNLESAEGLETLKTINDSAFFNKLKSAKGLEKLESIKGSVNFYNLESAKGLETLKTIGFNAYFNTLKSTKGLEKLEIIGKIAHFNNLTLKEIKYITIKGRIFTK
jgi:hypothetical protein